MNWLGLNKTSSKSEGDRGLDRWNISLSNHKNIKNKNNKTKFFTSDNELFIETTS